MAYECRSRTEKSRPTRSRARSRRTEGHFRADPIEPCGRDVIGKGRSHTRIQVQVNSTRHPGTLLADRRGGGLYDRPKLAPYFDSRPPERQEDPSKTRQGRGITWWIGLPNCSVTTSSRGGRTLSTATCRTSTRLASLGRELRQRLLVLRRLLLLLRPLLPAGTLATLISLPRLAPELRRRAGCGLRPKLHGLAECVYIATLLLHLGL